MAHGDNASKEKEVIKKTTYEGEGTSTVSAPDPEEPKNESLEEKSTGSQINENIVGSNNSILSFFTDFFFIIFLPIKPFYEYLKSANPVFNKMFQLVEEKAAFVLKLILTGSTWSSAWDLFKQVIYGLKRKFINFFLNPMMKTMSSYYYQIREGAVEGLDQIDRIYFNIVPAVPNVEPYVDSTDRNLPIRTKCLYMFLNLVHRIFLHSLNSMDHSLRYFKRKVLGTAVEP